jgi:hypothetical protein
MNDWQPAVIAPIEHVLTLHTQRPHPTQVSQYAGQVIRVRENDFARAWVDQDLVRVLGCSGHALEVHPEDTLRLWPELETPHCAICTCCVLTD